MFFCNLYVARKDDLQREGWDVQSTAACQDLVSMFQYGKSARLYTSPPFDSPMAALEYSEQAAHKNGFDKSNSLFYFEVFGR